MTTYVALLRGINVGKNKRIAMGDLPELFEELGYSDVKTHLNSGNVIFMSAERSNRKIASDIEAAINESLGMNVPVVVRTAKEMQSVLTGNPFPEHEKDHQTLHVAFLSETPEKKRVGALADVEKGDDDYRVMGDNVYLYYPNKLTGAVFMPKGLDKALEVAATIRNWRTVAKLAELASA